MLKNISENLYKAVDSNKFKSVLSSFATGITVITSKSRNNELVGFTANSFTSVSLEPPLVLFCLGKDSSSIHILRHEKKCVINILCEEQKNISHQFAYGRFNKFKDIKYIESINFQCPIITGSLSWLECLIEQEYIAGDHSIFICRVIDLNHEKSINPLIYHTGQYKTLNKNL